MLHQTTNGLAVITDGNLSQDYSKYVNIFLSKYFNNQNSHNFIKTTLSKTVCNPWITKGIIASIKIRNKLIRKKQSLGLFYKSKIRHYIKILRENYFIKQINIIHKKNPKIQWELLCNYLKINKKKTVIDIDCNKLNNHYVNIGPKLASKIPSVEA